MKCQGCEKPATHHVTEIVSGNPVEYHVCDTHLQDLGAVETAVETAAKPGAPAGFPVFWHDPGLKGALQDQESRQKIAAYLLPPLCLALLDPKPEVRVGAAYRLMLFGLDAQSALGALQDALQDPDERVRKAAKSALEYLQSEKEPPWFM